MAENDSIFADSFGEYDDWIEIYNSGASAVNLAGYYITDDDSIPTKYQIPFTNSSKTTIPAGGFIVLWADKTPGQGEDHLGFSLSSKGERIQLHLSDGITLVDKCKFGKQTGTISEGLDVDGGLNYIPFGSPTPGASNGNVCAIIPPKLKVNEVNYNSNLFSNSGDWVELYNTTNMPVDLSGWTFHDEGNVFIVPNGHTISPHGYYVLAAKATSFTNVFPSVPNHVGDFDFNLGSKEQLILFSASGCQVERMSYSDNPPWPSEPDGTGPTLSLIDTTYDNDIPGSWASSTAGGASVGTPGAHNNIPDPCASGPDSLVINEIMYNPGIANDNEWLEIYNPTNNTVNLENWEIHDEDSSYVFPSGITIAPKGYLVIASDLALFSAAFPSVNNVIGDLSIGLSNAGENLYLYSPGRCWMDFVDYNDKFPWVTDPDGIGPSLALKDPALENDKGANWGVSTGIGTPGMPNTLICQSTSEVYVTINNTTTLANASCPEFGWIYYYDPSNPDQLLFAIQNTGGIAENIKIDVEIEVTTNPQDPSDFTDGIYFHEDQANKRALFGMGRHWNVTYLPGSPQLPAATKIKFYFNFAEMNALTTAANNWNNTNFGGSLNVSLPQIFMKNSGYTLDPTTDYSSTGVSDATDYTAQVAFGLEDGGIFAEYANISEITGGSMFVKVNEPEVIVPIKVILEGPYNAGTGLMNDGIRQSGYIPTAHPFNAAPWNYSGTETIRPFVLDTTGNDAIVDWVLVEVRDQSTPTTILATQAALLQRDGDVVGMDGRSHIGFKSLSNSDYQIAVKHRNHLGVMTANPVTLNLFSNTIDLTTATLYGTDPTKIVNGLQVLWTGDSDPNFTITAADRSITWNNRNQIGYLQSDCTLDGVCNASDRSKTWNNRNKTAQLP